MRTIGMMLVLGLLTLAVPTVSQADDAPATNVSIRFENQEVVKVIRTLAEFGQANVIVSPQVKGTISVHLRDVPWKAALKTVVEAVGAKLIEEDYGILHVVPGLEVGRDRAGRTAVKKKRRRLLELEVAKRVAAMKVKGEMDSSRLPERAKAAMAAEAKVRIAKLELKALQDKVVKLYAERLRLQAEAPAAKERFNQLHVNVLRGTAKAPEPLLRGRVIDKDGDPIPDTGVTLGFPERPFRGRAGEPAKAGQPGETGTGWKRDPSKKPILAQGDPSKHVAAVKGLTASLKASQALIAALVRDRKVAQQSKMNEAALKFAEAESLLRRDPSKKAPLLIKRTSNGDYVSTFHFGAQSSAQARRRIENLQSAARHLLAAGDKEGAQRVRAEAVAAAERLRRHEALAKTGTPPGDVRSSIDGLHGEVKALRGEVRELTMLVRLLLQKQR